MPRIDEMPEFRAKIPHSTHDLSHSFGLTATVGHLMPIFHTLVDTGKHLSRYHKLTNHRKYLKYQN